jgi:hypothetical protein
MASQRTKVTVSLYDQELIIIEELKKRLYDRDLLVAATTSEIVRFALHHFSKAPADKLEQALLNVPDRRAGKPKKQVI